MNRLMIILCVNLVAFGAGCTVSESVNRTAADNETDKKLLTACGKGNLSIFEYSKTDRPTLNEIWAWDKAEYSGLPDDAERLFAHIDECQPFDGGNIILLTASTDGVALVDRQNKRMTYIGEATMAHSAAILPGGHIAVASSHGGDELVIFDGRIPNKRLASAPLRGGHGVEWDDSRQLLIALGANELKIFQYSGWNTGNPTLLLRDTIPLPDAYGHNLSHIPNSSNYSVSTDARNWVFHSTEHTFSPHPDISLEPLVKSISVHEDDLTLLWIKADSGNWWSNNIRINDDSGMKTFPVEKSYYKARWIDEGTGVN